MCGNFQSNRSKECETANLMNSIPEFEGTSSPTTISQTTTESKSRWKITIDLKTNLNNDENKSSSDLYANRRSDESDDDEGGFEK